MIKQQTSGVLDSQKLKALLIGYVVLELLLLVAIRLTEFSTPSYIYCRIMYAAIVLDFAVMAYLYIIFGCRCLGWRDNLIVLAFAFMLGADTFLCLIDDFYLMGYIFFCLVELCYAIYLKPSMLNVIIRAFVYAALLAALWLGGLLNLENAIAIFNLSLLICNVVFAWIGFGKNRTKESLLFAIGITLFLGCDGSIAARTLLTPQTLIHTIFAIAVWTAYIPAQVMILFSYAVKIKKIQTNESEN